MEYVSLKGNQLSENQRSSILKLLKEADNEFVPSLSSRTGTTQTAGLEHTKKDSDLHSYYSDLMQQRFVLALDGDNVVAFISYIPSYNLKIENQEILAEYVSTVIVSKKYRGNKISKNMYLVLFENASCSWIVTRTWSQNESHKHILKDLGFNLMMVIKNHRGVGVDTEYYGIELRGENNG